MKLRIPALFCAAALVSSVSLVHSAEAKRPNVIFILTDSQGWGDAHFAGHPYVQTPNLDRLASQSPWFKQFYVVATVCSPNRCAFMTSHLPARHEIHGHFAEHAQNAVRHLLDWLDPKTFTIRKLLSDAGKPTMNYRHFIGTRTCEGSACLFPSDANAVANASRNQLDPNLL